MRIVGAKVIFSRQLNFGVGSKKMPGAYAEKSADVQLLDGESFGESVQRAFADVKQRVCADLNLPPNSELK